MQPPLGALAASHPVLPPAGLATGRSHWPRHRLPGRGLASPLADTPPSLAVGWPHCRLPWPRAGLATNRSHQPCPSTVPPPCVMPSRPPLARTPSPLPRPAAAMRHGSPGRADHHCTVPLPPYASCDLPWPRPSAAARRGSPGASRRRHVSCRRRVLIGALRHAPRLLWRAGRGQPHPPPASLAASWSCWLRCRPGLL